jgi:SAM-dependent methyltransferase
LEPLGVEVFEINSDAKLPFNDASFDLVINRHESYSAREVYRILRNEGIFITQQVGGSNNIRLNELLQCPINIELSNWNLDYAVQELMDAGFRVIKKSEEFPETVFLDIGAVVFYLKAIPWQIPDFNVEKYHNQLLEIHNSIQQTGGLIVKSHRFYIEAVRE